MRLDRGRTRSHRRQSCSCSLAATLAREGLKLDVWAGTRRRSLARQVLHRVLLVASNTVSEVACFRAWEYPGLWAEVKATEPQTIIPLLIRQVKGLVLAPSRPRI